MRNGIDVPRFFRRILGEEEPGIFNELNEAQKELEATRIWRRNTVANLRAKLEEIKMKVREQEQLNFDELIFEK